MRKKTIFILALIAGAAIIGLILFYNLQKNTSSPIDLNAPVAKKDIKPSETFIDYTDPSGFTFSYPDNLSIEKMEIEDPGTYTDLQLYSKDVSGSLSFKITDTKLKSLDQWLKSNNIPQTNIPIEKKLGELKALEVKTSDRLMLASIDQGVLFTIESPLIEQDFWTKVYNKVITDFTFVSPQADAQTTVNSGATSTTEEIIFEGEEVVD